MARTLTNKVIGERRRRDVAKLYLQGYAIARIAERLEIHPSTVHGHLKAAREEWRKQATDSIQRLKDRELARIDLIELEAWEAWELSKTEDVTTTVETAEDLPPAGQTEPAKPGSRKVSRRQHNRLPGDQYLDRIAWCVEQRCKLLGLYPVTGGRGSGDEGSGGATVLDVTRIRLAFDESSPEQRRELAAFYERLGLKAPETSLVIDAPEAPDDDA